MGQAQKSTNPLTPEEYLALEREAGYKSEYYAGEIFAMAGASIAHSLICVNISSELRAQLKKKPCRVFNSDMRAKVEASGLYTYPDVSVVCGEARFDDNVFDTLLNPVLIVEVLSKSTEGYDRGVKFKHYRQIDSLKEYVLVSQDHQRLERFERKSATEWLFSEAWRPEDKLTLSSIGCSLSIEEVYDKVELNTDEERIHD